jgi:hypothetical protein
MINRIIANVKETQPKSSLGNQHGIHRIWKIRDTDTQQALIEAFANVGNGLYGGRTPPNRIRR